MSITLKKNSIQVLNIKTNLYGNLKELRSADASELAKQELGASLEFKFISYNGNGRCTLVLERSDKKQVHNYSFNLKAEKFLRAIIGIGDISFSHNSDAGKFNAKFEINKDGDVKSIVIKSTGAAKSGAVATVNDVAHKELEYDVAYEKTLASTDVLKSTGTMKMKFHSFKNFVAELNMDKNFAVRIAAQNQRNPDQMDSILGNLHTLELNFKHLDNNPVEKLYKLSFSKQLTGSSKKVDVELIAKKGLPNKLNDAASLDHNLHFKTSANIAKENIYFLGIPRIQDRTTKIVLASKKYSFNGEFDADLKYDVANNLVTYNEKLVAEFPYEQNRKNKLNAEFSLKRSLDMKTTSIRFKRSSEFPTSMFKHFKSVDVTYDRTTTSDGKANIKLNAELAKRPDSDRALPKIDNVNIDLTTGCFVSTCDHTLLKIKQTATSH